MEMWKCGKLGAANVEMWNCGNVELWKCGIVEMWKCGKLRAADVEMWKSKILKYQKCIFGFAYVLEARSEDNPTVHIHTFTTSHQNPRTSFSFSKMNWVKCGSPWGVPL